MNEFEHPFVLQPSKLKHSLLLLVSLVFAIGGGWMAMNKGGDWQLWLSAAFFGLGSIVFIVMLLPNSAYLKLTREGFEMRTLFRSSFYQWSDVENFRCVWVHPRTMVGFDFSPTYTKSSKWRAASRVLVDCEGALPDTYGRTPEQLVSLMNTWQKRFTASASS